MSIAWHTFTVEDTLKKLNSKIEGLNSDEAAERLAKYGYNEIRERKRRSPLILLLDQFKSILVLMLIVAAVFSFTIGEMIDAVMIAIIIILNAILGFTQEYRAEKSIEALKKLAAPKASVLRDGIEVQIPAREVVPGDIIVLKAGDKIPADARIVEAVNLMVDESILTGESIPVQKSVEPIEEEGVPVAERRNMVFMATTVTYGRGKAVVVATGESTEFGKIAKLIQEEEEATPLQRRLERFGKWLVIATVALTVLAAIEGLLEGLAWSEVFLTAISLAVSAVPEGLPAVVTITLALGVQRMARRKAIIRRLAAVETLGSATVICTDKTGTITSNELTVRKIYVDGVELEVTGTGYSPEGELRINGRRVNVNEVAGLKHLLKAAALCNDANLIERGGRWSIIGDPTEGALVVLTAKAGFDKKVLDEECPRVHEFPFDSIRKRMTTIHREGERLIAYMKGAPEVVLERCSKVFLGDKIVELNDGLRRRIMDVTKGMAENAMRVLGFAFKELDELMNEEDAVESDMVFIGLVGMIDPPRPEVKDAVRRAKEAGVRVIMVTGDHALTALAIAKEVGIVEDDDSVITGVEIDSMSDEEFDKVLDKVNVFARVAPEHKLRIVEGLKRKGHVVAMTGDGVNDAPSVKRADIGIAMGIRGSDVTREAADMILADDNFATIVAAIEEGRVIYDNIRKFIRLLLSANWDEILAVFAAAMADLPIPFTPIQILWINLVTDGLPALALGVDPAEEDVMKRPPRSPKEEIYHGMPLFIAVSAMAALVSWLVPFWLALQRGESLIEARTVAFTQAVIFELVLALNCRSERRYVFSSFKRLTANRTLIIAIAVSLALHVAIIYLPPLQIFFKTVALTAYDWVLALGFSALSMLLYPGLLDTRVRKEKKLTAARDK